MPVAIADRSTPVTSQAPTRRTRRALLSAALGAGAATIVAAVARPLDVVAANGDVVHVGQLHLATSPTWVESSEVGGIGLIGGNYTAGGRGIRGETDLGVGVEGASTSGAGVFGFSSEGRGVHGSSFSAAGVSGESMEGVGVAGHSAAADKAAILGTTEGSTAVMGYSGEPDDEPAALPNTGVYGYAAMDAAAAGVVGKTTLGRGVAGIATLGTGAMGSATSGIGTRGYAANGTALFASTSNPKLGIALRTVGRVRFDKSVGVSTVPANASSVTVTPGIDLSTTSAVVATLQGPPTGAALVKSVAVNVTTNKFTIYFTAPVGAGRKVAWHVFG